MKESYPLVSIICLCYNHARFVEEALQSVFAQTYQNIEIIIVDDASTDNSVEVINSFLKEQKSSLRSVKTIFLKENLGNCKAFNKGLAAVTGKYVIDFATDDVMLPERLQQQVDYFEDLPLSYGVVFTEAAYVDEGGGILQYHFRDKLKYPREKIPNGNVFTLLLKQYFICGPTMMIKKEVYDYLEGYDEQLSFEDFDFWVRSSRFFQYAYLDECSTLVRKFSQSMSAQIGKLGDKQIYSTYLVCKKAFALCETNKERKALSSRIKYQLWHAIITKNKRECKLFYNLFRELENFNVYTLVFLIMILSQKIIPVEKILMILRRDNR